jgi:hypothetical protein
MLLAPLEGPQARRAHGATERQLLGMEDAGPAADGGATAAGAAQVVPRQPDERPSAMQVRAAAPPATPWTRPHAMRRRALHGPPAARFAALRITLFLWGDPPPSSSTQELARAAEKALASGAGDWHLQPRHDAAPAVRGRALLGPLGPEALLHCHGLCEEAALALYGLLHRHCAGFQAEAAALTAGAVRRGQLLAAVWAAFAQLWDDAVGVRRRARRGRQRSAGLACGARGVCPGRGAALLVHGPPDRRARAPLFLQTDFRGEVAETVRELEATRDALGEAQDQLEAVVGENRRVPLEDEGRLGP